MMIPQSETKMREPIPSVSPNEINGDLLRNLVGLDACVVLEIGANDGSHTNKLFSTFPNAKIHAFEPDPRAIAKFKARGTDPRVSLFEMAIGAKDGQSEFHVSSGLPPGLPPEAQAQYPQGWDQSGSLRPPKTHKIAWPWCKFETTITVPVRRLDSWAREHGVHEVDFIWADTQGAEGDLIAGGRETLAATRYFYTEYSNDEWYEGQPNLEQLLDMLPGFAIQTRYAMNVLLRNTAYKSSFGRHPWHPNRM